MEAVLDHPPIDNELLIRLGRVVVLGSQIEGWISLLLGTLMGADLGGLSIVTNSLSLAAQIKCVRGLLSVRHQEEDPAKRVAELLDRADQIRADRNELVHGSWDTTDCEQGTAIINTANLDRAEIIRDRLITTSDLDDLIAEIEQWIKDYATLGAELGFPRNKNATQSIFLDDVLNKKRGEHGGEN